MIFISFTRIKLNKLRLTVNRNNRLLEKKQLTPGYLVVGPRMQTDVNQRKNWVSGTIHHAFKALQRWQNYPNIALLLLIR